MREWCWWQGALAFVTLLTVVTGQDLSVCRNTCSSTPQDLWPYCCEAHNTCCQEFVDSCLHDCLPRVPRLNTGDVSAVEERPGMCCALYNLCCFRESLRVEPKKHDTTMQSHPVVHRFSVQSKPEPQQVFRPQPPRRPQPSRPQESQTERLNRPQPPRVISEKPRPLFSPKTPGPPRDPEQTQLPRKSGFKPQSSLTNLRNEKPRKDPEEPVSVIQAQKFTSFLDSLTSLFGQSGNRQQEKEDSKVSETITGRRAPSEQLKEEIKIKQIPRRPLEETLVIDEVVEHQETLVDEKETESTNRDLVISNRKLPRINIGFRPKQKEKQPVTQNRENNESPQIVKNSEGLRGPVRLAPTKDNTREFQRPETRVEEQEPRRTPAFTDDAREALIIERPTQDAQKRRPTQLRESNVQSRRSERLRTTANENSRTAAITEGNRQPHRFTATRQRTRPSQRTVAPRENARTVQNPATFRDEIGPDRVALQREDTRPSQISVNPRNLASAQPVQSSSLLRSDVLEDDVAHSLPNAPKTVTTDMDTKHQFEEGSSGPVTRFPQDPEIENANDEFDGNLQEAKGMMKLHDQDALSHAEQKSEATLANIQTVSLETVNVPHTRVEQGDESAAVQLDLIIQDENTKQAEDIDVSIPIKDMKHETGQQDIMINADHEQDGLLKTERVQINKPVVTRRKIKRKKTRVEAPSADADVTRTRFRGSEKSQTDTERTSSNSRGRGRTAASTVTTEGRNVPQSTRSRSRSRSRSQTSTQRHSNRGEEPVTTRASQSAPAVRGRRVDPPRITNQPQTVRKEPTEEPQLASTLSVDRPNLKTEISTDDPQISLTVAPNPLKILKKSSQNPQIEDESLPEQPQKTKESTQVLSNLDDETSVLSVQNVQAAEDRTSDQSQTEEFQQTGIRTDESQQTRERTDQSQQTRVRAHQSQQTRGRTDQSQQTRGRTDQSQQTRGRTDQSRQTRVRSRDQSQRSRVQTDRSQQSRQTRVHSRDQAQQSRVRTDQPRQVRIRTEQSFQTRSQTRDQSRTSEAEETTRFRAERVRPVKEAEGKKVESQEPGDVAQEASDASEISGRTRRPRPRVRTTTRRQRA